jgi:hypothetical protein
MIPIRSKEDLFDSLDRTLECYFNAVNLSIALSVCYEAVSIAWRIFLDHLETYPQLKGVRNRHGSFCLS